MIDPIAKGALVNDSSLAVVVRNTSVFQTCLNEQSVSFEPLAIPGKFYVGPLFPKAPLFLAGDNRLRSQLIFDSRDSAGVERDGSLFDFATFGANGSIIERVNFVSAAGQNAYRKHVGFQFRRDGKSNRNIKFVDVGARGFSDAFIELPNSWNCSLIDMYGEFCGRPKAENGSNGQPGTEEGAFLRIGYQDAQPDTMTSSGNVLKNFYLNGCNHGINCQGDVWPYNVICFQLFEQIYCEVCNVGIWAPMSMDCQLHHCYFEANLQHGAVMGHATHKHCRHKPNTTDDIVINQNIFPWSGEFAHSEFNYSERKVSVPDNSSRELWAPRYGLVSFASEGGQLDGIARIKTDPVSVIRALTTFGSQVVFSTTPPNLAMWAGKIAVLAPGDYRLWVQNRSGKSLEFAYHIMGAPWSDSFLE